MAQTKPKAGQFYGVSNNGTDGEFLQTDGVGGMTWAAVVVNPTITSIDYSGSSTAADPAGGETVLIVGTGFLSGATVLIGSVAAPSVTLTSSAVLTITTPAGTAGTYSVTVTNADGGTVTQSAFFQYDGVPTWTTAAGGLGSVTEGTAASFQVTATEGSDTIEYAVTTGSLPVGLSLATATGAITGTAPAVSADTTTTFSITATDDENQTSASRSFSIIVSPPCTTSTVQIFGMDTVNEVTPSGFTGGLALYQLNGDANDVSGNYNGTATSVTYATGLIGQAGSFSGSSSKIDIPVMTGLSDVSFSCWINTSDTTSGNRNGIVLLNNQANGTETAGTLSIFHQNSNGEILVRSGNASSSESQLLQHFDTSLTDGNWHHLVVTRNESTSDTSLYVDGYLLDTENVSRISTVGVGSKIGNRYTTSAGDYSFKGSMDQIRIFSTALSAANVSTLYNEGVAKALYQLNWDGSDLSGNYNGTPTNVTFSAGKFNNGGVFNGSSSYITTSLNLPTNYSISFWVKKSTNQNSGYILGTTNSSVRSGIIMDVYADATNSGMFNFIPRNSSGGNVNRFQGGTSTVNVWTNIVITYNSSLSSGTFTFYQDGSIMTNIILGTNPLTNAAPPSNSTDLTLGRAGAWTGDYFNGLIDQTRVFSKVLNSTEVTTLYNEVLCTPQCTTNTTNYPTGVTNLAYYKLDGNANDVTTVYNGTESNVTWTNQGRFGSAGSFNGSSSFINIEDSTANAFGFANMTGSISVWVNPSVLGTSLGLMAKRDEGSPGNRQWILRKYTDNKIQFIAYQTDSTSQYIYSNSTIDINIWTYVTITLTTTEMKIYLNGQLDNTQSTTYTTIQNDGADLTIGRQGANSNSNWWNGSIDQVRIFSTALTQANITDLYNEVAC